MLDHNFDTRAFGGFDKQQVLDYIADLIEEQEDALDEKNLEISTLQKRLSELEEQKKKADAAMLEGAESLKEQGEALNTAALKEKMLKNQKADLEKRLAAVQETLEQEQTANLELHDSLHKAHTALEEKEAENKQLAEKARELQVFEERQAQVQTKLNELLAKAHAKGDDIVRNARDRGIQIINEANGVAAATYASCSTLKNTVEDLAQTAAMLQRQLQSPVMNFETHLDKLKQAALNEKKPSELLDDFIEQNLSESNA